MKKIILSLLCLWVSIGTFAQFSGSGSGTKDDPYLIFNPIQLNQVRGFLNKTDVYFKMMSDIDLTEWIADENPTQGWQPIGTSDSPFMGVFDGNGHTISGFIINRSSTDYVGFFAKISQATIQNVTINGPVTGKDNTGGVAGYVDKSTLSNIVFNGDVSGQNNVGGISGQDETGDNKKNTTFETCKYSGNIKGTNYIGGINGYCRNTTNFTNCEVHANITGNEKVGGIAGFGESESTINITSCFAYGSISGRKYVGGLVGRINQHTITGSGAIMDITSTDGYTGGIVGGSSQMQLIKNFIPRNISNTFTIGDIISKGEHVGGIVGDEYGNYSYTGTHYSNLDINNCYYSGNIQGTNDVGGIVGKGHRSQINKCYSTGTVTGNENVGGIVGRLSSETECKNTVKSCVSIHSKINALTSGVGRIFGKKEYGTIGTTGSQEGNLGLTSCRVVLNGVLQSVEDGEQNGGSAGRSTLKTRGTYQAIGWNFNDDWDNIDTECYPYMKGQMAPPIIESGCYSGSTEVKGKSTNGGTVYLNTNGKSYSAKVISNQWSITTEPLQGGLQVEVYADAADMIQSYKVAQDITYKGKGTEAEPYQICTAADLANANGNYYYKLMNNIDLTDYISTHCSAEGWRPIGKGSSAMANFDGDGHTVSGLWINTTDDYVGLFSNASGAHIKNLKVVVASGKKVKGGNYTGGIIGRNYNGSLENCSFSGDVEGGNYTGGVIGYDENSQTTKISGKGNVTGGQYAGGIIGYTTGGTLQKAVFEGNVTSSTASAYIGGVVGGSNSALSLCTSKGTAVATGTGSVAGGVIGKIDAEGSLTNAYSMSEATSVSYVGGVVGYNYGSIKNCYSSANLKSDKDYGGGVVGYNDGASATTSKCVAINTKIEIADENGWASRVIGGIKNGAPVPDMDNFANKDMTISINGQPMKIYDDNLNGASKTLDVLKAQSTYEGMGWDFTRTWAIDEGNGYPYLLAELPEGTSVSSISLDKKEAVLEVGKNVTLTATILPEEATDKSVTWSSDNESVATVADGVVTAVAVGTANITAKTNDGSNLSATCTITVIGGFGQADTDISKYTDIVYTTNEIVSPDSKFPLEIKMKNAESIVGFQFDLKLPKGMSIAYDTEAEDYDINLSTERTTLKRHSLSYLPQDNGTMRIVCTSGTNQAFNGNDGNIVTVMINIDKEIEAGDYPVYINNIEMTTSELKSINVDYCKSTLTVKDYTLGDVNNDGKITVTDAACVVAFILGSNTEGLIREAADVNQDGKISVTDAACVVDIILHEGTSSAKEFDFANISDGKLGISSEAVVKGDFAELDVNLNSNYREFTGMQFDLVLPEGMKIAKTMDGTPIVELIGNSKNHNISAVENNDGTVRVVCFSSKNETFEGYGEAIVRLCVAANGKEGMAEVGLRNIELVRPNLTYSNIEDQSMFVNFADVTGITTVDKAMSKNENDVYNLKGMHVNKDYKGIIVNKGKKIIK